MNDPSRPDPAPLPLAGGDGAPSVPVFDCIVILRHDDETDAVAARVANLHGFEATASTERDALLAVTKAFKAKLVELTAAGEPIPWKQPPDEPSPGESRRFVPVHL